MLIQVGTDLHTRIEGVEIATAPTIAEIHALLGPATRIAEPATPAPVKHRNTHWHIYDADGLYFNEHHYTRRVESATLVFWPEEHQFLPTPQLPFSGKLLLAGYEVSQQLDLRTLVQSCPIPFEHRLGGWVGLTLGEFSINITVAGVRLPSGRRSEKDLRLVAISLGWPHDPWGAPAEAT